MSWDEVDGVRARAVARGLARRESLESISMDMWDPYIQATLLHVPDAEKKIGFDRFHAAKHIGDGVDKVRIQEHAELQQLGDDALRAAARACGYRNRARFREAILFHCGGLDLYPRLAHVHTKS